MFTPSVIYIVQDLTISARSIRYRRERWLTPDGPTMLAPLPAQITGHFADELQRFILAQYHQVPMLRLVKQLRDFG